MANSKMPLGVLLEMLKTMRAGFRAAVRSYRTSMLPGMGPGPSISLMQEVLELRARVEIANKFVENVSRVETLADLAKAQDEYEAVVKKLDGAAAKPEEFIKAGELTLIVPGEEG